MEFDKLVAAKVAQEIVGFKRSAFYELAKCEGFPERHFIGNQAVRWSVKELMEWREKQKGRR